MPSILDHASKILLGTLNPSGHWVFGILALYVYVYYTMESIMCKFEDQLQYPGPHDAAALQVHRNISSPFMTPFFFCRCRARSKL